MSRASKIRKQICFTLHFMTLKMFLFCISSCRIVCVKLIAGSGSEQESAPGFVTHSILAVRRIQFISTNLWVTHEAFCRSSELMAQFITWNIFGLFSYFVTTWNCWIATFDLWITIQIWNLSRPDFFPDIFIYSEHDLRFSTLTKKFPHFLRKFMRWVRRCKCKHLMCNLFYLLCNFSFV